MSERRVSASPPTAGEVAALRKVVALTETQISTICALIATLSEDLEKTSVEQRQLEAELAARRQSLLEWTRSRDLLAKAHLGLITRAQSYSHVAYIREKPANPNPTATPSDDELTRKLVEQDSNDIDAIRVSMDMRALTISILRSRIMVVEEEIAGCQAAYSHTSSMIASEASHKDQLHDLLGRYKSRLNPLILLPDPCLQDVFLYVVQLAWEACRGLEVICYVPKARRKYVINSVFVLTAVCHRWRTVATHTPELWSKYMKIFSQPGHAASRLAHHVRLLKNRELSILVLLDESDIQSLEIIKSSNVKLDTLVLLFFEDRDYTERAMKILPSPRILALIDLENDFLPISLPQELLSRTEWLYTRDCHVTIEFTAPTLQGLKLLLERIKPSTTPRQYIPTLLQNIPQLRYLIIQCQTTRGDLIDPQPLPLLVSPGACESITCLQIPLMALCGPLKALQTSFTLPNLIRLSLSKFLQEGSDHQSWGNFCQLNGGKIKHLDLDPHFMHPFGLRRNPLLPDKPELEVAQHLNRLAGIKHLSLHAFFVHPLMLALLTDDSAKKDEGREYLLLPNMEICKIRGVESSAVKARFEEAFSSWSKARKIKEEHEASGQHVVPTVLWT